MTHFKTWLEWPDPVFLSGQNYVLVIPNHRVSLRLIQSTWQINKGTELICRAWATSRTKCEMWCSVFCQALLKLRRAVTACVLSIVSCNVCLRSTATDAVAEARTQSTISSSATARRQHKAETTYDATGWHPRQCTESYGNGTSFTAFFIINQ